MDVLGNAQIKRIAAPVRQQVEEAIRAAIVEGRLRPGERLVEAQLCEHLGVSRPIVREALRQLEAEGLIAIIPHHGARVASVTAEEARQIFEVRAQLEGLAGRGFAAHARPAALRELKAIVAELQRAAEGNSGGRSLLAIKQRFYAVLLNNCGNEIVRETLERLNNRINLLRAMSLSQSDRLVNTVAEIRRLIDALERRDAEAAYTACVYHVEQAADRALQALAKRERE